MTTWLVAPYLLFFIALVRAFLVGAQVLAPTCARCGLKYEREQLGERVCSC